MEMIYFHQESRSSSLIATVGNGEINFKSLDCIGIHDNTGGSNI